MSRVMTRRAIWLTTVLAAWLAAPCAAQRTWLVDSSGGPGVDFTDLPPAVAAASPGDTILLRWGTGAPYGFDLTIRRGIRIIGDDTAPISVRALEVTRRKPPALLEALVEEIRAAYPELGDRHPHGPRAFALAETFRSRIYGS